MGGEFGADLLFDVSKLGEVFGELGWRVDSRLGGAGVGEDAVEGVVVLLRDGVEFVVVAAGAGDGEALEGFGDDVDLVVGPFDAVFEGVDGLEAVFDHAEVGEGEAGFVGVFGDSGRDEVAGEVFADELVVGDVVVEGADEVVAVAPGVGSVGVAFGAVGFAVADDVHPAAGHAFAEFWGGEEAVDDLFVGLGFGEFVDFFGGGREAGEVEGDSS